MSEARITLLTRAGCTACATAAVALDRLCPELRVDWRAIDVDAEAARGNRELRMEFGDRLPVVLLDGAEHSYSEVDESRLRSDLARPRGSA